MAVTVEIDGIKAVVEGGEWSSPDKFLAQTLDMSKPFQGVPTSNPDPDFELASQAVEKLGGEITKHDKPEFVADRIY